MFQYVIDVVSLVANICVLSITAYTFYLTTMSTKLKFVSMGFSFDIFNGDTISISLENTSLHAISISSVFIIKKMEDGDFHQINIFSYDDPLVIQARHVERIITEPYTYIMGLDSVVDL